MDRLVVNDNLYTLVYAPLDFNECARRAMDTLPDEWHTVVASPSVVENEDGTGSEYLGARFTFYTGLGEGDRLAAFIIERPEQLLDDGVREHYLASVRHALRHPEHHPRLPETTWRVGS